jgi:DNA-directed RNA polymerase subunit beta
VSELIRFGRDSSFELPHLTGMQREAYDKFLQIDVAPAKRKDHGLESILRESFPIYNFDRSTALEYVSYSIGQARYSPDECRMLRLTYGAPLKVRLRLAKARPVEEEVYLGDIPLMLGGGTFIINGAERCVVSQLHRSPGIDFMEEKLGDRTLHSCWIVPERGSWIELGVTRKDTLAIRIDQGGKLPATLFLRACAPELSTTADLVRAFHPTQTIKTQAADEKEIAGKILLTAVLQAPKKEPVFEALTPIPKKGFVELLKENGIASFEIVSDLADPLVVNSLQEEAAVMKTTTHEEALLKIYSRMRPGTPQTIERAKALFHERFFDPQRYRLGAVGRFRLNRKFGLSIPESEMTLQRQDVIESIKYLMAMRRQQGHPDDIDHLGNRRVRMIDELAGEEIRKGFLRLKRSIQERLNVQMGEGVGPKTLVNSKTVSAAIEYFFARSDLSQVVDQTNPLSQLTHERRLSALGPGGLNRKRAGFEVRDVHLSHYGRVCPIETPEGTNIGLITSLALFAGLDSHGFITAPYRIVKHGKVTDEIVHLRADQETDKVLAPADTRLDKSGRIEQERVLVRINGEFCFVEAERVEFIDVDPSQIISVSAALIPFLEHDDANRALMGSNMQRQAVPLLRTEAPVVSTGMEEPVARYSDMVVVAEKAGRVTRVTGDEIVVDEKSYPLTKYRALNERTCQNQRPCVREGDHVKRGQVVADGCGTERGVLALGRNLLVAFMPWDGYNFEDAIVLSQRLVREDAYTSVHIEEFEVEVRETRLGREEFTREIPNVSERALRNLGADGVIQVGTYVRPGDILVGKVAPKSKTELSAEEKLLHAIFGRVGEDVKNESLEVPPSVEGTVIAARTFSRKSALTPNEKRKINERKRQIERDAFRAMNQRIQGAVKELTGALGRRPVRGFEYGARGSIKSLDALREVLGVEKMNIRGRDQRVEAERIVHELLTEIERMENEREKQVYLLQRGDELPAGVLEMVKVWVATKRNVEVGDKMAGRHGNKGVIARILPEEDMPFLEDGTPVDVVLNPLGVPSRMNVGQILEVHLGWAARKLGLSVITPPFNGADEADIEALMEKAGLPKDGKVVLYDGRTGQPFAERVTVGIMYFMKLHHLVADKIHARATGRYSLITQQPLGGKARMGGQRFGEMEVWALEAYGAANILQELLTVKSDNIDGRTRIYDSMVKGTNILEPGTPVSFEVLCNEIRGLGLSLKLEKSRELI